MLQIRGRSISMIFQEPTTSLNPVLPVGFQIAEVLIAHLGMRRARGAAPGGAQLMKQVGIPAAAERVGDYPHQMSGGMRQRVMIAMAIACRPRLLIADEPTTALDVTMQAQILRLIKELQTREGMAVLMITHDLGVIARVAHRVAVMYAGQIVETGPVRDIFRSPRHPYTRMLLRSIPRVGRRQVEAAGHCRDDAKCRRHAVRLPLPPALPGRHRHLAGRWRLGSKRRTAGRSDAGAPMSPG